MKLFNRIHINGTAEFHKLVNKHSDCIEENEITQKSPETAINEFLSAFSRRAEINECLNKNKLDKFLDRIKK